VGTQSLKEIAIVIAMSMSSGCAGPDPSAHMVELAPSPKPGCERATVSVDNDGGEGEVTVELTLQARDGARTRDTTNVEMKAHERLLLTVDVAARPDDYTAIVSATAPD
jgi:hypothetical protein